MRKSIVAWAGACLVLCLPLAVARAAEDHNLRELELAQRKVKELRAHAAELKADGQHERAAEYRAEADALEKRVKSAFKRLKKGQARQKKARKRDGDLVNTLEGLEQGIEALRKLGKNEEAEHLHEIAEGVRRRIHGAQKQRGMGERELVKQHIETLRLALRAFMEAGKKERAEHVEHAIHARELGLEGRRDEKAIHIRKTAPNNGHLAELLHGAAELYGEWGHPDRAERCAKLSQWFGHRWRDQQARKKGREHDARRERDREREVRQHAERRERERRHSGDDRMQAAMERIERLEERLNKVIHMLEEMHQERGR